MTKMNRDARVAALNKAGVDTSKYFQVKLPGGLKAGDKIELTMDENGNLVIAGSAADDVEKEIYESGYVKNSKLHRRWIMAQMFRILNRVEDSRWGVKSFDDYVNRFYGYGYWFKMMVDEVKVLSILEEQDEETFEERRHFFTEKAIVASLHEYRKSLSDYIDGLKVRHCKGEPYKRIPGVRDMFVVDINSEIFDPLNEVMGSVLIADSYRDIYDALKRYEPHFVKLPSGTKKPKAFIDAFKGEGAYYTMKNLFLFHGCGAVVPSEKKVAYGEEAYRRIKAHLTDYEGYGYRYLGALKEVIKANDFHFGA